MRVFLIQTAKGLFPSSGGYRANNALLRYLSSRGHRVRQLCYSTREEIETYVQTTANNGNHDLRPCERVLHLRSGDSKPRVDVNVYDLVMDSGVEIVALDSAQFDAAFGGKTNTEEQLAKMIAEYIETKTPSSPLLEFVSFLRQEIVRFSPTHIISNDGLSMQATCTTELANSDMCRVAVVHTAEQLPFGPFAGGVPGHSSSPRELDLLRDLDGIWSVSEAVRSYALEHGQLQSHFLVHHPWTYLGNPQHETPPHLHNWDKKYVGMINPCKVKGSDIFTKLAKACPQYEFLAYLSWGVDDQILKQMEKVPNITIRPTCSDEELWRDIKVLVVPSLWLEAWGMVAVEAHIRGIPVVSSNAGALPEAMLGIDYIVPVNPLKGECDKTGAYIIPDQDIRPWVRILNKLLENKSEYERLSAKARNTTTKWLQEIDETALEKWLLGLVATTRKQRTGSGHT